MAWLGSKGQKQMSLERRARTDGTFRNGLIWETTGSLRKQGLETTTERKIHNPARIEKPLGASHGVWESERGREGCCEARAAGWPVGRMKTGASVIIREAYLSTHLPHCPCSLIHGLYLGHQDMLPWARGPPGRGLVLPGSSGEESVRLPRGPHEGKWRPVALGLAFPRHPRVQLEVSQPRLLWDSVALASLQRFAPQT